jgi:hypothetical protein
MILESAKTYLATTSNVKIAHLVQIELAGSNGVYGYVTDYQSDIAYNGNIYVAGKITSVGSITIAQGLKNYKININVAGEFQEELDRGISENSYEGRRLNIFKAYLDEANNIIPFESTTNGPVILFKGKIGSITISEDVTKGASTVSWACEGLLADFEKVNGRLTDDTSHRGLVSDGITTTPIPSNGAKREAYKTDTGFLHSNQTVSSNISYISKEKEYYLKKSWGGLKTKLREREVDVERRLELNTSLSAKFLPVIYGVRKVTGIPVFLDVNNSDPSLVYCVYAVCEGEIDAFLNVYVDGISAICGNSVEALTSGVCMGSMENGDTLSMYAVPGRQPERVGRWLRFKYTKDGMASDSNYVPAVPVNSTQGTKHGDQFTIAADKGAISMAFYHGKPDQEPDPTLVSLASFGGFKLQNSIRKQDGSSWGPEYWSPASPGVSGAALLDTAYVVATFRMSEQRDSIPTLDFIVSGKKVRVYSNISTYTEEVSINPVWQLLDYLTNPIYGAGLAHSDLNINSFISVAAKLNTQDTGYDVSYVKYWRYLGWLNNSFTRAVMQCNTMIETENSITKVVESILEQFDGTLAAIDGVNELTLEGGDLPIASIDISEVIGAVRVQDRANKDKWNAIDASITDPGMNWSTNQINFFNSNYLVQDNGIRKKGRAVFNYITNYYTARAWAERQLNKSRYSKTLSFTTFFKYSFLKPNDNITFNYPRFGYNNSKFTVKTVELLANGSVRLELVRYEPEQYTPSSQPEFEGTAPGSSVVAAPANLLATLLPNVGIPINTPNTSDTYLLLHWDIGDNSVLRYEVSTQEAYFPTITSLPSQTVSVSGTLRHYALIPLSPSTTYTFKVQAIYNDGSISAYSILEYTTGSSLVPTKVAPIENFRLVNSSGGSGFFGPDVLLSWDAATNIDSIQVRIIDPISASVVFNATLGNSATDYTFTLTNNKAAYAILEGGVGAFRNIKPEIRAEKAGVFSEWRDLSNV